MGNSPEKPIFVFDFEGNVRENILEYAVVALREKQIWPLENDFCRQNRPDHFLQRQKKIPEVLTRNAPLIDAKFNVFKSLRENGLFAAHHAATENDLLRRTWANPGAVPDHFNPTASVINWGPWIDSKILCCRHFPQLPSRGLESLIGHFQLRDELAFLAQKYCPPDRQKFHCALFDAFACAILLREIQSQFHLTPLQLLWGSLPNRQQKQQDQITLL